jgi:predicted ATPase
MTAKLTKVHVAGFRSLREVTLDLTPVTLLIGPNGSGKSNLLSVLRMVPLMRTQSLRRFVGE